MLPLLYFYRRDGLHAERVVEPALRERHANLAVDQFDRVTFRLRLLRHPRQDRAGELARPQPHAEREAVVVAEIGRIARVVIARAVEGECHLDAAGRGCVVELPPLQQSAFREPVRRLGRLHPALPLRLGFVHVALQFAPSGLGSLDLRVQVCELLLLVACGSLDVRRGVAVLHRAALLRHVVEVREELVELALRNRVELVVVAPGAADREAEPHGRGRIHAVHDVLHRVLFRHDAAFGVAPVVAVEAGRDALVERRTRQHVARELLDGEPVERQVAVVRLDHPVAPAPHVALAVGLVAVSVRVPGGFEPAPGHALAVPRRREQAVGQPRDREGLRVRQERIDFRRGGWKARQVEGHSPDQCRAVRFPAWRESFFLQSREGECVDRVRSCVLGRRHLGAHGSDQRPVLLPLPALRDPRLQCLDLLRGERAGELRRRHAVARVVRRDALNEFALGRLAGHDDRAVALLRAGIDIEAQVRLPLARVRAVARKAVVREDRPHVAVEVHLRRFGRRGRREKQ